MKDQPEAGVETLPEWVLRAGVDCHHYDERWSGELPCGVCGEEVAEFSGCRRRVPIGNQRAASAIRPASRRAAVPPTGGDRPPARDRRSARLAERVPEHSARRAAPTITERRRWVTAAEPPVVLSAPSSWSTRALITTPAPPTTTRKSGRSWSAPSSSERAESLTRRGEHWAEPS